MLMCPYCGWQYTPKSERSFALVPHHRAVIVTLSEMSAAALDAGAVEEEAECPGVEQHPRNPTADRRPLWSGKPSPAA